MLLRSSDTEYLHEITQDDGRAFYDISFSGEVDETDNNDESRPELDIEVTVKSIVRKNADWTSMIEVVHESTTSDNKWAQDIVRAAERVIKPAHGVGIAIVEHDAKCQAARSVIQILPRGASEIFRATDGGLSHIGRERFRAYYYPEHVTTSHVEIEEKIGDPQLIKQQQAFREMGGVVDVAGIMSHPEPGIIVVLYALHDEVVKLDRFERSLLSRVGLHIETSYRLRRRPELVKAILDSDGRVLERSGDAPPAHALTAHAHIIERARSRKMSSGGAIDLWPALVAGRVSLVERGTGKRRRYYVVENAPAAQPFRSLTEPEIDVVSHAARGLSTKMIAYALGLSPSTVSARLAASASKVGAASRMELVRLAAMLTRDPRARFPAIALTTAERDVLQLLQQGLSNEEIAAIRSRSTRTIANQVASLLRKTKSASRRALVVQPHV